MSALCQKRTRAVQRNRPAQSIGTGGHFQSEPVTASRFAAGAEAHLTGTLADCAGSCGPGNLHLINGLFDANRSRVPVLAIAAQILSVESSARTSGNGPNEFLVNQC